MTDILLEEAGAVSFFCVAAADNDDDDDDDGGFDVDAPDLSVPRSLSLFTALKKCLI
jgi:hypothetical protein